MNMHLYNGCLGSCAAAAQRLATTEISLTCAGKLWRRPRQRLVHCSRRNIIFLFFIYFFYSNLFEFIRIHSGIFEFIREYSNLFDSRILPIIFFFFFFKFELQILIQIHSNLFGNIRQEIRGRYCTFMRAIYSEHASHK